MATGNVGAQCIMILKGKQKSVMYKKVMAFVVFGVFLSGPLGHAWLKFLNGHKTKLKGQSLILYKIALDRLGCANVTVQLCATVTVATAPTSTPYPTVLHYVCAHCAQQQCSQCKIAEKKMSETCDQS